MVQKKRNDGEELFINLDRKSIDSFFKNFNRSLNKNIRFFKKNVETIKKTFVNYEEPYCELNQSHKGINIRILLPNVKKKDIVLNIFNDKVELKAESRVIGEKNKKLFRIFYRTIDLPSCSVVSKAKAEYKRNKLKIKIPFKKIK